MFIIETHLLGVVFFYSALFNTMLSVTLHNDMPFLITLNKILNGPSFLLVPSSCGLMKRMRSRSLVECVYEEDDWILFKGGKNDGEVIAKL